MPSTDDLVLGDQSGFTIGSFIRTVLERVPSTVSREKIEATLETLQRTYDTPNLEDRFVLFADDVVIEDPAGLQRGRGRAGMEEFFRSTFDNGVRIFRKPVQRIIVGNEALEHCTMRLEKDGLAPDTLPHHVHYVFNENGLIRSMRVFFDLNSIGT